MIMKEDFVTYDIAVKLKEKGFKEKCFAYYYPKGSGLIFNHNQFRGGIVEDCLYSNNSLPNECMASDFVDAPTIPQVLKWFRKEKKLHIVCPFYQDVGYFYYVQEVGSAARIVSSFEYSDDCYEHYEQAALVGIKYVIDNLI